MGEPEPPWMTAVRWATTTTEPILDPAYRHRLESDLERAIEADPEWGIRFYTGVCVDIASTLPGVDPWRQATISPETGQAVATGGMPFGTVIDHTDLCPQVIPDLAIDVALVATFPGIEPAAAAIVVHSFTSHEVAAQALRTAAAGDPAVIIETGFQALRWLLFRRRNYGGLLDMWGFDSIWFRAEREWKVLHGIEAADDSLTEIEERQEDQRIDDTDYDPDPGWIGRPGQH